MASSKSISAAAWAPAGIYVLRVAKSRSVQISRGENSGPQVTYTNVVRAIRKVGDWTGAPLKFKLMELRADDEGYVVLLQRGSEDSLAPSSRRPRAKAFAAEYSPGRR